MTAGSARRNELRAARRDLERANASWPVELREVPVSMWPQREFIHGAGRPKRVWRSRGFLVQAYGEIPGHVRLSICRAELDRDGKWTANISWEELQELKRQAGFGDYDAVEVFPRDCDVVNVANMRHLWVVPEGIPFAWRGSR